MTDRAKRSHDREERACKRARGDHAQGEGPADRGSRTQRCHEVSGPTAMDSVVRERSYGRGRSPKGPDLLIPCGELWEHLTPIREVAFIYVVKVQLGGQVT